MTYKILLFVAISFLITVIHKQKKQMSYITRPATNSDLEWLDPFYEELMKPYVELTHKWDRTKFRESFSLEHTHIIQFHNQDIGMLKVEQRDGYIFLGDIQIKKEFQGKGIGSRLINDLIQNSKSQALPIRLRVLKGNPAIKLYQRVGFALIHELDNCYELEYSVDR